MDAAECRRLAEHYFACARQMTNPKDREALLKIAEHWQRLAEEKKEAGQPES